MTYWLEDANGYVGDFASNKGLMDLRRTAPAPVVELLDGHGDAAAVAAARRACITVPRLKYIAKLLEGAVPPVFVTDGAQSAASTNFNPNHDPGTGEFSSGSGGTLRPPPAVPKADLRGTFYHGTPNASAVEARGFRKSRGGIYLAPSAEVAGFYADEYHGGDAVDPGVLEVKLAPGLRIADVRGAADPESWEAFGVRLNDPLVARMDRKYKGYGLVGYLREQGYDGIWSRASGTAPEELVIFDPRNVTVHGRNTAIAVMFTAPARHFNPNHDPGTGEFSAGGAGAVAFTPGKTYRQFAGGEMAAEGIRLRDGTYLLDPDGHYQALRAAYRDGYTPADVVGFGWYSRDAQRWHPLYTQGSEQQGAKMEIKSAWEDHQFEGSGFSVHFNPNHDELGRFAPGENPGRDLTAPEHEALVAYVRGEPDGYATGHNAVNGRLRGKQIDQRHFAEVDQAVANIDSAFTAVAPLAQDATLYRGMYDPELKIGDVVSDRGFVSTSRFIGVAEAFADKPGKALAVIKVPVGARVLSLEHRLGLDGLGNEREVLLPRGAKFRVVGYEAAGTRPHTYWPTYQLEMIAPANWAATHAHPNHDELGRFADGGAGRELTADEETALRLYVSGADHDGRNPIYRMVNAPLRAGQPEGVNPQIQRIVSDLDSAFTAVAPLSRSAIVYRSSTNFDWQRGDVLTDEGFVSTSMDLKQAKFFLRSHKALMVINVPAGARVLNVGKRVRSSALAQIEREVLLPRGSRFRVRTVDRSKRELPIVELDMLPAAG